MRRSVVAARTSVQPQNGRTERRLSLRVLAPAHRFVPDARAQLPACAALTASRPGATERHPQLPVGEPERGAEPRFEEGVGVDAIRGRARSLGADVIVEYKSEDFEATLSGYDLVLHSQDAKALDKSLRVLPFGSTNAALAYVESGRAKGKS